MNAARPWRWPPGRATAAVRCSLIAAAILVSAASVRAQAQASVSWRLASGYSADSFHTKNLQAFAREVDVATTGALKIEVHPAGALVPAPEIRTAVEAGKVEAGEAILTSMVKVVAIAGADSVPFVARGFDDARRLWTLQRPVLERGLAEHGLVALYAVPWPAQDLYSRALVRSVTDLRATRMRNYNDTTVRIAELLGATAVDVPMAEVGAALAAGRVDSMITSAVTGVENRVWDHLRHYYTINAWLPKNIVFVNAKAFAALPAVMRDKVRDAAAEAESRGWSASQAAATEAIATLRQNGVRVERLPPDLEATLRRMGERFSREWVRGVGPQANEIFVPYYAARVP